MTDGPLTWRNTVAARLGEPPDERIEATLYGDAYVVGGYAEDDDPHQLLSVGRAWHRDPPRPIIVTRATYHLPLPEFDAENMKTRTGSFHGADGFEELAALISLGMGIRCRSGGPTRHWFRGDDISGFGSPSEYWHRPPSLQRRGEHLTPVIPRTAEETNLTAMSAFLHAYYASNARKATAITRSARLYQQALWVADEDPNLAFIWFVGAIEVAAGDWHSGALDPGELLRIGMPDLSQILLDKGADHHDLAAQHLAHLTKATQRFVDFTVAHLPEPPPNRPKWGQVDWTTMDKHLRKIYGYRSEALHAGTPFPHPMGLPPREHDDGLPTERPDGLGAWALGGEWVAKDLPMLLCTFEYVVWGALTKWWLAEKTATAAPGQQP